MNNISRISELAFALAKEEASLQSSKNISVTHLFISVLTICDGFHQAGSAMNRFRFFDAASRNEVNSVFDCLKECRIDPKFSVNKLRVKMYRDKEEANFGMPADDILKISSSDIDQERILNFFGLVINIIENKSEIISEHFDEITLNAKELTDKLKEAKEEFEKDPNNLGGQAKKVTEDLNRVQSEKTSAQGTAGGSYLLKYGVDITRKAELGQLNKIVGRKNEIKETARILLQKQKGNPLLIGEAGVGKTSIVEGLAQYIKADDASYSIKNLKIIQINMNSIIAGSKYRGDFEEKIEGIINEAAADKNIVLFIDEIHTMMGAGGSMESSNDAANMLKPALASGQIRCIGATTITEYKKHIEKDGALKRRFQLVNILEPTAEQTIEMLKDIKKGLEKFHGVEISDSAAEKAVNLSVTFLPELRLPDKAIEILDRACSERKLGTITNKNDIKKNKILIDENDIYPIVARRANVPVDNLLNDVSGTYKNLPEKLKEYISGQDEAIEIVSKSIQKSKAGFKDEQKPVSVFLFLGNTGTGKTYLAECLAQVIYGSKEKLLVFDMSEYKESNTVARLMGSPPGYIGYDEEGQLSKKIGRNPASVVLFDEIEKADSSIMDIFIQMFDKGRVTDSSGRVIDFRQTIIILTSNLITNDMQPKKSNVIGFNQDER